MDANIVRVCRICFEEETKEKKVIHPCYCKGSSKYIHEDCLRSWIHYQEQSRNQIGCEVCKYNYKIEEIERKKCNPNQAIGENSHFLCYIGLLVLMESIFGILLYIIIEKDYINPKDSIIYFIGILSIFVIASSCTTIIIVKLCKLMCCITIKSEYKIFPIKDDEDVSNTTNINQSQPRLESANHYEGVFLSEEIDK